MVLLYYRPKYFRWTGTSTCARVQSTNKGHLETVAMVLIVIIVNQ